jgi:hypothetical protein
MSALHIPPVALLDPLGHRQDLVLTPGGHVALFVRAIHAPQIADLSSHTGRPGLIEACRVRREPGGKPRPDRGAERSLFASMGDVAALQQIARSTRDANQECWVSVCGRPAPQPGGAAVPGGRVLWADCDTPQAIDAARKLVRRVPVRLLVESAGARDPGERRRHLYLLANRWLGAEELEAANARLAELLGSDRVGDRGRLMRLPGTVNRKGGSPGRLCRIVACDLHSPGVDLDDLLGAPVAVTPRPKPAPKPTAFGRPAGPLPAVSMPAREWFALLEPDRPVNRHGYARCPLHDDTTPSLKLYDPPQDGWYCWGCARGGDLVEYLAWRRHGRRARDLDARAWQQLRNELEQHTTPGRRAG